MNSYITVSLGEGNTKKGSTITVAFNNVTDNQYDDIKEVLLKYFGIDF